MLKNLSKVRYEKTYFFSSDPSFAVNLEDCVEQTPDCQVPDLTRDCCVLAQLNFAKEVSFELSEKG